MPARLPSTSRAAEVPVSHRIDAAVDAVEAPRFHASPDSGRIKIRSNELLERDDAVLPTRSLGNDLIWAGELFSHTDNKSPATDRALVFVVSWRVVVE
jgi:hypothetical protein